MNNRQHESSHFKLFRQLMNDFPKGEVWHDDDPDFLLHTSAGVVGVEHRRLFKPPVQGKTREQELESQERYITAIAQDHAEINDTPVVQVSLFYNMQRVISGKRRLEVGRAIARLVHENLPAENGSVELKQGMGSSNGLPLEVDIISILRSQHLKSSYWRSPKAGWVLEDCIEIVQSAIDDKAVKINSYLQKCNECWLLLVPDAFHPSGSIHPNGASLNHVYHAPFNRTYFLDYAQGKLYLLKIGGA